MLLVFRQHCQYFYASHFPQTIIQGFQPFPKMKFHDFSMNFPWSSLHFPGCIWNETNQLRASRAKNFKSSMQENRKKQNSMIFPWCILKFHDFSMIWHIFQIPWFFQVWKMILPFSRIPWFFHDAGNPDHCYWNQRWYWNVPYTSVLWISSLFYSRAQYLKRKHKVSNRSNQFSK